MGRQRLNIVNNLLPQEFIKTTSEPEILSTFPHLTFLKEFLRPQSTPSLGRTSV